MELGKDMCSIWNSVTILINFISQKQPIFLSYSLLFLIMYMAYYDGIVFALID